MLDEFRDIMIIICAFLVIGAALIFSVLTIIVFRKVSTTLNTAQGLFSDLRIVSSFVSGRVVAPITRGAILAAGIRKAIVTISERSHRKEKKDGDRG
jgi:hypothetical protein